MYYHFGKKTFCNCLHLYNFTPHPTQRRLISQEPNSEFEKQSAPKSKIFNINLKFVTLMLKKNTGNW